MSKDFTFFDTFKMQAGMPIAVCVLIFGISYLRMAVTCAEEGDRDKISIQHMQIFLFYLFTIYPSVSNCVLNMFRCEEVDGISYLAIDLRIQCSGEWVTYAWVAFGATLLYPIGIPTVFYLTLKIHRDSLFPSKSDKIEKKNLMARLEEISEMEKEDRQDPVIQMEIDECTMEIEQIDDRSDEHERVIGKYGFVYGSYVESAYYFELTELIRKLLLTGVVIFVAPGSLAQMAFAFIVTLFFLVFNIAVNAFVDKAEGGLMFNALLSTLMTIFCGILLKAQKSQIEILLRSNYC